MSTSALLFDTSSLFFRAHHALPPMSTSFGQPTAALYGFSVLLLKLLRELRPDGLAFARDLPRPTFRHTAYAEYKAGRPPMPDALRAQWSRLTALIDALGVPSHALEGFEADDVLATLARSLDMQGARVTIVSGDRDLLQTVGPSVQVLFVGARGKKPELFDAEKVQERYGVPPSGMPMRSALVGEAADNLVGVAGVGPRTASKLIERHRSARALYASLESVEPIALRESLRGARERVLANEDLARLRADLPLESPLVLPLQDAAIDEVGRLFESLEFKSLQPRLHALRGATA